MNESAPAGTLASVRDSKALRLARGRRIKDAREARRLTQLQLAERLTAMGFNVSRGAVGNWELGDGISGDNLNALASVLGVEILGQSRQSGDLRDNVSRNLSEGTGTDQSPREQPEVGLIDLPMPILVDEADMRTGGGGYAGMDETPLVRTKNGITIAADLIRDRWGIPETYLRGQLRISSGRAYVLEVYGDSMYDPGNPGAPGSFFPGDRVVIDSGDTRPSPPGPFVVWDGVGLVVKLVELVRGTDPARLRLKSRNPNYADYEVTEDEAKIVGRVRSRISVV